jgi:CO/xanthine dehydrogenase FAD-binding subunit
MKFRDFLIPRGLEEARAMLGELGAAAMPLAGGTGLYFLAPQPEKTVVDITRIGLDGIERSGAGFRIGAAATVASIQHFREPGFALGEVASRLATQQIRNVSTIGGNIARVFPWADFPVALLALEASVTVLGKDEKTYDADEYFKSQPARLFKGGELLTAVTVPALEKASGFGYHKEVLTSSGFSMMTAAARLKLDGPVIRDARLAAGAAVSFPRRLTDVEERLRGEKAGEEVFEKAALEGCRGMTWKGKEGSSDEYAAHLARVVLRDVLVKAMKQAKGA